MNLDEIRLPVCRIHITQCTLQASGHICTGHPVRPAPPWLLQWKKQGGIIMFLMPMIASPVFWVLTVIWYILVVAGAWMMFQKAGEAGWKAIIPIYNMYIVYKICWNTSLFWVWFGISVPGPDAHPGDLLLPAVFCLRPWTALRPGTLLFPLHLHGDPGIRQFRLPAVADEFTRFLDFPVLDRLYSLCDRRTSGATRMQKFFFCATFLL